MLSVAIGILVALLLCELACTVFFWLLHGTISVSELHATEADATFVRELMHGAETNRYLKSLYPHPYLGFVHSRQGAGSTINNVGLFGPDFPTVKDPNRFTILLTGGSVAMLLAQPHPEGIRYLEEILNERYDFGGKEVVILCGAAAAWREPHQPIMLLLYADVVDAVITLDGYNEVCCHYTPQRLEHPSNRFHDCNPLVRGGPEKMSNLIVKGALYDWSRNNWLISKSRLAYLCSRLIRNLVDSRLGPEPSPSKDETTVESIFSLPPQWTQEQRDVYNIAQYRKYVAMTDAMAKQMRIKSAFFIQPVPVLDKSLTDEEKVLISHSPTDYGDLYRRMVDELLSLRQEGVPVFSLVDVFKDYKGTIYGDFIHCRQTGPRNESPGFTLMAERMATLLEQEWHLAKRDKPRANPSKLRLEPISPPKPKMEGGMG